MINVAYERKLHALRAEIMAASGAAFSIEQQLSALLDEDGVDVTRDLLLSLSDEAHGGAMYALVHAAESLDKQPYQSYISAVLSTLPELFATAPQWALAVLRRIMNANASLSELVQQLSHAPAPIRQSVLDICKLNDAICPDYIHETVKSQVVQAAS